MLHLTERLMITKTTRPFRQGLCLLATLFFLLNSCGESIEDFTAAFQNEGLKVYLDRFDDEATSRDISLDLSRVEVVFASEIFFNGQAVCSRSFENFENQGNGRVEISRVADCWENRNDQERENLIFREFGAAILERITNNAKLPNSLPASMMCNDCDIFTLFDASTIERRDFYVNELFQIEQVIPDWGN